MHQQTIIINLFFMKKHSNIIVINAEQTLLSAGLLIIAVVNETKREITFLEYYNSKDIQIPYGYQDYKITENSGKRINVNLI